MRKTSSQSSSVSSTATLTPSTPYTGWPRSARCPRSTLLPQSGKSTLGFVNPALYALHRLERDVFRDVKEGSSKCPNQAMTGAMVGCCKHGFRTGKGWDPLTGLGSVDFERLMEELLKLP